MRGMRGIRIVMRTVMQDTFSPRRAEPRNDM
jgi:hypothetical protein